MGDSALVDLVCGPVSPLPETYQRYRLVARLGAGGQADVYRGVRLCGGVTSAPVTVKVFRLDPKRPLVDELRSWDKGDAALMDLNNRGVPSICRRVDGFYGPVPHPSGVAPSATDAVPYQVYDYLHGVNLREYVTSRAGVRGLGDARRLSAPALLAALAETLRAMHHPNVHRTAVPGSCPVLHMDVKPSNIMVLANGDTRLIDFTGARYWRVEEITRIAYTPESGGPEALRGEVSPSYDVHGFGSVAFYLLAGVPPRGANAPALHRHPLFDGRPALRDHLLAVLADDPNHRTSTAELPAWSARLGALVRASRVPDLGLDWREQPAGPPPAGAEERRAVGRARPVVAGTETDAYQRIQMLERELVAMRARVARPADMAMSRAPVSVLPAPVSPAPVFLAPVSPAPVSPAPVSPAPASVPISAMPISAVPGSAALRSPRQVAAVPVSRVGMSGAPMHAGMAQRTTVTFVGAPRTASRVTVAFGGAPHEVPPRATVAFGGAPVSAMPASAMPASAMPASGMPVSAMPASGMPASGMPASAMPASAMPASGMPASAVPASAMPASAMPASGAPGRAMPASGVPARAMPASAAPARAMPRGGGPRSSAPVGTGPIGAAWLGEAPPGMPPPAGVPPAAAQIVPAREKGAADVVMRPGRAAVAPRASTDAARDRGGYPAGGQFGGAGVAGSSSPADGQYNGQYNGQYGSAAGLMPARVRVPTAVRLRRLKRGGSWSILGASFALVCWIVWAAANRSRGVYVAPMVFVGTLAVALGVFVVLRLLGRLVLEQWLHRTRRGAVGAHLGTGLFLIVVGVTYLQQTTWVITAVHWLRGL